MDRDELTVMVLDGLLRHRPDGPDLPDVAELVQRLVGRPDWHRRAACRGIGPDVFFPGPGGNATAARRICATCPVTADCLTVAVADGSSGIWAGTTETQRRVGRRRGTAA